MVLRLNTDDGPTVFRDLQYGDQGGDVYFVHHLLSILGFEISREEIYAEEYGISTKRAVEELQRQLAEDRSFAARLVNYLLTSGSERSLEALLQISQEDIQEEIIDSDGVYSLTGRNQGFGNGVSVPVGATEQVGRTALEAIADKPLQGRDHFQQTTEFASRFLGQRGGNGNSGAIVDMVNGYTGDPWCGGFANYVLDRTMPGVYDQDTYLSARSYITEGKEHGAFHRAGSDYRPKEGDVIVFSRGSDPSKGHVGIVTAYDETTGKLTYISGNAGNAVRLRVLNLNDSPDRLLGFTDSEALARAKGIELGARTEAIIPRPEAALQRAAARAQLEDRPRLPVMEVPSLSDITENVAQYAQQTAADLVSRWNPFK